MINCRIQVGKDSPCGEKWNGINISILSIPIIMLMVLYGNGVVTDYHFDPLSSRLLSLTTGSYSVVTRPWPGSGDHTNTAEIQDKSYTYSNAGDIETITDHLKGATYTYYYDLLHRLTAEVADGDDSVPAAIVAVPSYVGPGPVHAAKSVTSQGVTYPFTYDANGNMLSGPDLTNPGNIVQRAIVYDAENMPVDINNGLVRIIYDADNSRAIKTGGTHVFYINDNYEEINGVGTKYIFAGNQRIAQITGQSRNYFHQDHLGSATVVTDGNSPALVESAEYLPFGMTRNAGSLITTTNYQYTDQEHDAEINLYNYDARLYDPAAGSFISADSVVPDYTNPQSLNRFSYVLNNPLVYTDPTGNEAFNWQSSEYENGNQFYLPELGYASGVGFVTASAVNGFLAPAYNLFAGSANEFLSMFHTGYATELQLAGLMMGTPELQGAIGYAAAGVGPVLSKVFGKADDVFAANGGSGANISQYQKLKGQLLGEEVAQGHAFDKHILSEGQFNSLGIRTRDQFAAHAGNVFQNPSSVRYYKDGRTVFLQESTSSALVKNPVSGESTMYQVNDWAKYLQKLPSRTTPY
ncbi:MAG: RHS repeat-associated core domain-containing protein [Desulfobulbaceae bacterium]|nr:RHS repeat-associated core domain-containing protein [Desulfobulbaceae bacterium]